MDKGVMAGLRTLFWAIVLRLCLVYLKAALLRQAVGVNTAVTVQGEYLSQTLPWFMFPVS